MMKRLSIWIGMIIYASGTLQAQQTFHSLGEVWEYALSHNAGNHIHELEIEQAKQDKKSAGSFLFPSISGAVNGQDNLDIAKTPVPGELVNQPGETVYLEFAKHYSYNAGINVNYNILDWQAIYQSKISGVNLRLEQAGKVYFEQNLKEQLAQFYFASLTAEKAVEIGLADVAAADTLLQNTLDRFREGTTDALAVNQARINKNKVSENLESSRQYLAQCLNNLKILLGLDAGEKIELTEDLSSATLTQVSERPLSNLRYLETYRLQQQMSVFETKKAKSLFLPQLGLKGYYGKYQYQDDFTFSFDGDDWKPSTYIGVSVTIPIFTGFSSKSRYSAARIGRQSAESAYRDEVRKSAINDSILYQDYISTMNLSVSGNETYRLSEDNLRLAWQKYEQGLLNLDGYLDVFDDYLSAENKYLSNLSEFLTKKATIESRN